MEFKIAVIGTQMFGDLSVITGGTPSKDKIFKDEKLKRILSSGQGNRNLPF